MDALPNEGGEDEEEGEVHVEEEGEEEIGATGAGSQDEVQEQVTYINVSECSGDDKICMDSYIMIIIGVVVFIVMSLVVGCLCYYFKNRN